MTVDDGQLSFDFKHLSPVEKTEHLSSSTEGTVVSLEQIREQRYRMQMLERVRQARIFDTESLDHDLLEG